MQSPLDELTHHLHEIAWQFGPRGLNGECCGDLSMPEFRALKMAAVTSCSVQEIGSALDFTKSGATRVVDRLEKKGYVRRERSAEDGRICCVGVTRKGSETLEQIAADYRDKLKGLMEDMDPVVAAALPNVLSHLARAVKR